MRGLLVLLMVMGCGGKEVDSATMDSGDDNGACGEWSYTDIEVRASVQDSAGQPLPGIAVSVDDEATPDPALGEGTTDASGEVSFTAVQVAFAEGCAGTLFDYYLIATDAGGMFAEAKEDLNSNLYNATIDGSYLVDLRDQPLVMEPL